MNCCLHWVCQLYVRSHVNNEVPRGGGSVGRIVGVATGSRGFYILCPFPPEAKAMVQPMVSEIGYVVTV